mgnify:CR=1 FL=1
MPVFYFPKFFHPDPTVKRQSGFLLPRLNNSNILGSSISTPYFYEISENKDMTFTPNIFSKNIQKNYKNVISMNWHSIGRYFLTKFDNLMVVDFGSTTTDFICIKNSKIVNDGLEDFSRLSKKEMLYTGITRTPLFGLQHEISLRKKKYYIVPELFSNTSDIYRINNFIQKDFDIDDEADNRGKRTLESLLRISRSFCIDYEKKKKEI